MSSNPFPSGTRVYRKSNPSLVGTVLDAPPMVVGGKIRLRIKFDDGTFAVVGTAILEKASEERTPIDLVAESRFGSAEDLCDALLERRLSESIDDMIYSLNLTNTEFYPYQFKPLLTFLNSYNNSLLIADEVGLGKTIEAGLIWTELCMREQAQRLLVVCPAQLCIKWQHELRSKFDVDADIVTTQELVDAVRQICSGERRRCALIVSLAKVRRFAGRNSPLRPLLENEGFHKDVFQLLILDEAHRIRNEKTQQNKGVADLRLISENTLFLSATPIQTSQSNLFSLLHILDKDTYKEPYQLEKMIEINKPLVALEQKLANARMTKDDFEHDIRNVKLWRERFGIANRDIDAIAEMVSSDSDLQDKTKRLILMKAISRLNPINQIMTRTLKRHVLEHRVKRVPVVCAVHMTKAEKAYYRTITEAIVDYCSINDRHPGFILAGSQRMMASSLAGSYKYWLSLGEDREDVPDGEESEEVLSPLFACLHKAAKSFEMGKELLEFDSKFEGLVEAIRLQQKKASGRIIVFSFFKKTLLMLEEGLRRRGVNCRRIDGSVSPDEREAAMKEFEAGSFDILLCSEVAAEGVDLQFVDCLINYDLPWNPAKIEQRIGRIDRIGQKSDKITIINMLCDETIETRIYYRLLERLNVFEQALGVTEDVLGEIIDKLTETLFSKQLTKEEQDAEIERAALAAENWKLQMTEAEGSSSVVYDYLSQIAAEAKEHGKCIVEEDLIRLVESYCHRNDSQLIPVSGQQGLYRIRLSVQARADFMHFLMQAGKNVEATDIISTPDLSLKFQAKKDLVEQHVERVTANHPFIRFIVNWRFEKKVTAFETAAVRVTLNSRDPVELQVLPEGLYLYSVQFWKLKTKGMLKPSAKLAFSVKKLGDDHCQPSDAAELLVNKAARYGRTYKGVPQDRIDDIVADVLECEDDFENRFEQNREEFLHNIQEEAKLRIKILEDKLNGLLAGWKEQYLELCDPIHDDEKGIEGRRAIMLSRMKKKTEEIHTAIESTKLGTTEVQNLRVPVSCGVIYVERGE